MIGRKKKTEFCLKVTEDLLKKMNGKDINGLVDIYAEYLELYYKVASAERKKKYVVQAYFGCLTSLRIRIADALLKEKGYSIKDIGDGSILVER